MLQTSVFPGAALPADDAAIVKAMLAASQVSGTLARSAGLSWNVAVRNAGGTLYRRTTLHTRNQYARLALRLKKLGYANELSEPRPELGYDAIFSRTSPGDAP